MTTDNHTHATTQPAHKAILEKIRALMGELMALPTPTDDGVVADILGNVNHIERTLAKWRQGLIKETPPAAGSEYKIATSNTAKRSYASYQILRSVAVQRHGGDTMAALQALMGAGVLKLTWGWLKLRDYFRDAGLDLTIVQREVTDDEVGVHVGELWTQTSRIEGVKEGDEG